jgi:hypothetical protein
MNWKAVWLFVCAWLGANMMFVLNLAVKYRCNPKTWQCPCAGEFVAQATICLVVTILTFVHLWHTFRETHHEEDWTGNFDGIIHAALLELVIQMVAGKM